MSRRNRRSHRGNNHNAARKDVANKTQPTKQLAASPGTQPSKTQGAWGAPTKGWNTRTCSHWQEPFELGDGLSILASGYADRPHLYSMADQELRDRTIKPDVGFYLDTLWAGKEVMVSAGSSFPVPIATTETVIYPWPDYGVPNSLDSLHDAMQWLLHQMSEGRTVETGCFASHGRTGTLLACLLVELGMEAHAAIRKVRKEHCDEAVESMDQIKFVERIDAKVNGRTHRTHIARRRPAHPIVDAMVNNLVRRANADDEADYEAWQILQAKSMKLGIYADDDDIISDTWDDEYENLGIAFDGMSTRQEQCDKACAFPPCGSPYQCDGDEGGCMLGMMYPDALKE